MLYQHDYFLYRLFSPVNLSPKVDVFTNVCLFYYQAVGVEPTTEIIPVLDLPVTLSCPCSVSTKKFRHNSSTRDSGNLPSISYCKYEYWFPKYIFSSTFLYSIYMVRDLVFMAYPCFGYFFIYTNYFFSNSGCPSLGSTEICWEMSQHTSDQIFLLI